MAQSKRNRNNIKKHVLCIAMPYYYNSGEAEIKCKKQVAHIKEMLDNSKYKDDILFYVYEDGQVSEWLEEYKSDNIIVHSDPINKGVSVARNWLIEELKDKTMYIAFIDSDDILADDYFDVLYEYCADNTHDVIETKFWINGNFWPYDPYAKRSCCTGAAIRMSTIGNLRFDEKLQIGEDTKFMNELLDFSKHRKKQCPTIYYYQLGANPRSLTMLYDRKEIGKER